VAVSLWLILFVAGFVLVALEGAFFMRRPEIHRASQFLVGFLATGLMAAVVGALVRSGEDSFTLGQRCRALLERTALAEWGLRLGGAAGLYTLVYVAFGSATWPLVKGYYRDGEQDLGLRVPDGRVVITLQLVRGFLTSLVLLPLVASIPASEPGWWLRLSLLLAAVLGLAPLAMATPWPARLRILHAVEITLFAFAYAAVVGWLLGRPAAVA
jgi:hypothetical protein